MSDFSTILKKLRLERHVKQVDIASFLEVLPRTVRFYETGQRRPDFEGLLKLADYFDVSIDYLVGRTDNPKVNKL